MKEYQYDYYLASGFFTDETRKKVKEIAENYRRAGFTIFVPMEYEIPNAWDMSAEDWARKVFETDLNAINSAKVLIYLDFGASGDCGASWEVGYAYAQGIQVITFAFGKDISLMVSNSSTVIKATNNDLKLV